MITIAQYFWIIASFIFLFLGTLHLIYTFFTDKFSCKNEDVLRLMKENYPKLTRKTTLWKSWIGFNASHSSGAIFIGTVNMILAVEYFDVISKSIALLILTMITSLFYCFLGKRYWFDIPLIGITLSCIFYFSAIILILAA